MSNLVVLLRQQGKTEEAGKMSYGMQRGGLSRGSFNTAFLCLTGTRGLDLVLLLGIVVFHRSGQLYDNPHPRDCS